MGKSNGKAKNEKAGSVTPRASPPKTPWELVIALLWDPPWKRWLILVPLLIAIAAVNLVGNERLFAMAEDVGLIRSEEIKCWSKTLRPADSHIAGMRVVERSTVLDLSEWKQASADQLARKIPVELAISRNRFRIERTDENQGCFIHRMGTSSGIEPTVHCSRCRKVALPYKDGVPLREWDLVFDIRHQPVGQEITIAFSVDFWNSFQRPDQSWGGFRILHSTERAVFSIVFPEDRRPKRDGMQYRYVRSGSQQPEVIEIKNRDDVKVRADKDRAERLAWVVANPQPDRSYRVYWSW
jgi:hypothetical protein